MVSASSLYGTPDRPPLMPVSAARSSMHGREPSVLSGSGGIRGSITSRNSSLTNFLTILAIALLLCATSKPADPVECARANSNYLNIV